MKQSRIGSRASTNRSGSVRSSRSRNPLGQAYQAGEMSLPINQGHLSGGLNNPYQGSYQSGLRIDPNQFGPLNHQYDNRLHDYTPAPPVSPFLQQTQNQGFEISRVHEHTQLYRDNPSGSRDNPPRSIDCVAHNDDHAIVPELGVCPGNVQWYRITGGYRCLGLTHMKTAAQAASRDNGWYKAAFWSKPNGHWFVANAVPGQEGIEVGGGIWGRLGWNGPFYGGDRDFDEQAARSNVHNFRHKHAGGRTGKPIKTSRTPGGTGYGLQGAGGWLYGYRDYAHVEMCRRDADGAMRAEKKRELAIQREWEKSTPRVWRSTPITKKGRAEFEKENERLKVKDGFYRGGSR